MSTFQLLLSDKKPADIKPSCTVKLDDNVHKLTEFVVVGNVPGQMVPAAYSYCDTLMIGQALQELNRLFYKQMAEETDENQKLIWGLLSNDNYS